MERYGLKFTNIPSHALVEKLGRTHSVFRLPDWHRKPRRPNAQLARRDMAKAAPMHQPL